MKLDNQQTYVFRSEEDETFTETVTEFAVMIHNARLWGEFLEDRMITIETPEGDELGRVWLSELVADYYVEPCKLCGSYNGICICDNEADR